MNTITPITQAIREKQALWQAKLVERETLNAEVDKRLKQVQLAWQVELEAHNAALEAIQQELIDLERAIMELMVQALEVKP